MVCNLNKTDWLKFSPIRSSNDSKIVITALLEYYITD